MLWTWLICNAMARPVLVVLTPGLELEAALPLVSGLGEAGHDVSVFSVPCGDLDAAGVRASLVRQASGLGEGGVVVAHGLGALLALQAAPLLSVDRLVLLAPLLAHRANQASLAVATLPVPVGGALDGSGPLATVLLGEAAPLGCAPAPLLREVQGWVVNGVPVDLGAVPQGVWLAVGLRDELAQVEAVVPASRALRRRELVRLGVGRLDARDLGHWGMLVDPIAVSAAVRAVGAP